MDRAVGGLVGLGPLAIPMMMSSLHCGKDDGSAISAKGLSPRRSHMGHHAESRRARLSGTRPQIGHETLREWVRSLAEGGTLMTSVCTGSLAYRDAGSLDGRPATTHWASTDLLASLGD